MPISAHESSNANTDEWLTPPFILTALGGWESFDLDPCTPLVQPWPTAKERFTRADSGLLKPWFGRVFLNPPYYANIINQWMGRMADHGCGTALIFARTDTNAFFDFVWNHASALLFIRGRLYFHHVDGTVAKANSGAPSVLCAYGAADAEVLAFSGIDGQFIPLTLPRGVVIAALDQTWGEAIADWMASERGPVRLDELYRAFERHPKTRANPNWRAKIRQVLQHGPYQRVDRGVWAGASA